MDMDIQQSRRKYTMEYCQQFVGQVFGCIEILKPYYKKIENRVRAYATCRCVKCGRIVERKIGDVLSGLRTSCICVGKEKSVQTIRQALQFSILKRAKYNQWEYIDPSTVRVYLSDGGYFITDACSWMWLRRFSWRKFTRRNNSYIITTILGSEFKYHALLLAVPPTGYVRDHINRNTLDNRYENLRVVSFRDNALNNTRYQNKDYVCYNQYPLGVVKVNDRYIAQMCLYGNRMRKYFDTLEEAVEQRQIWEKEYNQIVPLESSRLFLPDGTLNIHNFRFDWYDDKYWLAWNHIGINLIPAPRQDYLRYMPTKDVMDFGYNGVYL